MERKTTYKAYASKHLRFSINETYFLRLGFPFIIAIQSLFLLQHATTDCGDAGVAMTTGTCIHISTTACVGYGPDSAKQVQMVALSSRATACDLDFIAQNLHYENASLEN
jgi:hypothetical protein